MVVNCIEMENGERMFLYPNVEDASVAISIEREGWPTYFLTLGGGDAIAVMSVFTLWYKECEDTHGKEFNG